MPSLRPAIAADLDAINAIYNYYVERSTATYQTDPDTAADRQVWFSAHGPRHPVIVATEGDEVIGWGSLSPFHRRAAYGRTVENSIYVRHDRLRQGMGGLLLRRLIELGREVGHHAIIALIDAEQTASVALHERHGFERVAHLKEVGRKYGRWLDVIYMELLLQEAT